MDRRYYTFKAFLIAAAFVATAAGGYECSRLSLPHDAHYQATVVAQSTIYASLAQVGNTLSELLRQAFAEP